MQEALDGVMASFDEVDLGRGAQKPVLKEELARGCAGAIKYAVQAEAFFSAV
jgi:hypothetical protein